MITLYGSMMSRAPRCHWMLNELGLDFKVKPIAPMSPEQSTPEFLAVNPNGKVPVLDDGGTKIFESMAINLYLAMKYGKGLWPNSVEDQGRTLQWSHWVMSEMEPHLIAILIEKFFKPEGRTNEAKIKEANEAMKRPLKVLDDHLKGKDYLLGNAFSVADVNVASVLSLAHLVGQDYKAFPNVQKWYERCLSRPAFAKATQEENYKAA